MCVVLKLLGHITELLSMLTIRKKITFKCFASDLLLRRLRPSTVNFPCPSICTPNALQRTHHVLQIFSLRESSLFWIKRICSFLGLSPLYPKLTPLTVSKNLPNYPFSILYTFHTSHLYSSSRRLT